MVKIAKISQQYILHHTNSQEKNIEKSIFWNSLIIVLSICDIWKWKQNCNQLLVSEWDIQNIYLYHCKNRLVTYYLFTDDLTFMFEIKISILKMK